jgi:hypothetical protein
MSRAEGRRQLGKRERVLLIVFGAAVVLFAAYKLLSGGGGEIEGVEETPRGTGRATPTASPSPSPSPIPFTAEAFEGRDPFLPLVVEAPPTPPGPAPSPTATGGPRAASRLRLVDIFPDNGRLAAKVEVDGDPFTVHEGETFAGSFMLLDLTESCGSFVFGDERFQVCVGQEIQK